MLSNLAMCRLCPELPWLPKKELTMPVSVPTALRLHSPLALAALVLLTASAAHAQTVTVTFEDLAQPGSGYTSVGPSYTSQGYVFTDSGPGGFLAAQTGNSISYAGSTGLSGAPGGVRTLRRSDGGAFTLSSLDLSLFARSDPNLSVTYTGTKTDQSTVMQTVVVDAFGFETYPLNGFSGLTQVTFGSAASARYQFDNVVLSAAPVPEASTTVSLGLLLGLGGLVIAAKRRKAAPSL